jgi:hypothetical protein
MKVGNFDLKFDALKFYTSEFSIFVKSITKIV